MFRRRRPLLGAAMLGGTYLAGKSRQRSSYQAQDQEARLEQLEAQQAQQAAPAAPPAPPPQAPAPPPPPTPAAGGDMVSKLKELAELKSSGVLSQEEFDAAKAKLLAS